MLLQSTKGGSNEDNNYRWNGNDEEKEIVEIRGKELLDKLGILAFEAMIMKNNEIVRESELLTNHDKIKILNMIHGG